MTPTPVLAAAVLLALALALVACGGGGTNNGGGGWGYVATLCAHGGRPTPPPGGLPPGPATRKAQAWLRHKRAPQIHRIFGYAATGKTTMAKPLAATAGGAVEYACFTGKAAQVLRTKGCDGASTIHSLIYKAEKNERTGEVKFKLNRDSRAAYASLIINHEVSMVGGGLEGGERHGA